MLRPVFNQLLEQGFIAISATKDNNEAMVAGSGDFIASMALASVDANKQPECCINCHSCEKVCPQTIHIPEELKKFILILY